MPAKAKTFSLKPNILGDFFFGEGENGVGFVHLACAERSHSYPKLRFCQKISDVFEKISDVF
jgi:hypothetical protein